MRPMPPEIANKHLESARIPNPEAPWSTLERFALTFNGYRVLGDECATIANERRQESLTDLRACLFYEQRRWRHFGEAPDDEAMSYIRGLILAIRERVVDAEDLLR